MQLSKREKELFERTVYWAVKYNFCNPEVGMGPSIKMITQREAKSLSFDIDDIISDKLDKII